MESSGVPVVFEACETLVLLHGWVFRCRACASFPKDASFPKESVKWDGNKMKSGTGEGVLTLVQLEKYSNTSFKQNLVLAEIHLDFDS